MQQPQMSKRPSRMSDVPIENRKPSVLIELLVWVAFIIPIIFLWLAFQSVIMVGIVIAVRILIMGVSHYDRVKKANTAKVPKSNSTHNHETRLLSVLPPVSNTGMHNALGILSPFVEEATSEIIWLLEKTGVYNRAEESRLKTYRKFRGWE